MSKLQNLLDQFNTIAASPRVQLDGYLAKGKKVVGCFPYYVPEELVYASDMIPFGIWGAAGAVEAAKEYFAPFYCTIAQKGLELSLNGSLNGLSGVIMPSMCDTLRPLTQNFQVANPDLPFMFLAHPQNRRLESGIEYTIAIYSKLKSSLEAISGVTITDEKLREAIKICNSNRSARREFVKLAGEHPEAVSAKARCAVLKSSYFMDKSEHTVMLNDLNVQLKELPISEWGGAKVVVSGIINDNLGLLEALDEHKFAIVSDDVAHESRGIRIDVSEQGDPVTALAMQFAEQNCDPLLYDPELNCRHEYVTQLAKDSGAQGVIVLMMQFCDPEELEYPSLKGALDGAGIPHVMIGFDQQMENFGQAGTILQTFAGILSNAQ